MPHPGACSGPAMDEAEQPDLAKGVSIHGGELELHILSGPFQPLWLHDSVKATVRSLFLVTFPLHLSHPTGQK